MVRRANARNVDITVISGLSGAGRSEVAKVFEDLGYFVVDNLPPALIRTMMKLALTPNSDIKRIALVIDARGGRFFEEAARELEKLRRDISNYRLVFLEASDEILVRRFEASRRRHPLATGEHAGVGIQREREVMKHFREGADLIIDTSELSVRELRTRIRTHFSDTGGDEGLHTTVISFGYKFGLPIDADVVLDVRFLPNPHWVEGLRDQTGLDEPVKDYVLSQDATGDFMARVKDLFAMLLPAFQKDSRHFLTVAVGCTGGRHRSVVLSEEIAEFIRDKGFKAKAIHRDVERPPVQP
ncbi:MAG: RNase adapter RapZ [Actinomycetota bacterium]|nr:RNase adapter RapZ [Actinomycetota bacterium]